MKKFYRIRPLVIQAEPYKINQNLEDGWRLYYYNKNYGGCNCDNPKYITLKNMEELETVKTDLKMRSDIDNPIIFKKPIAVIKTIRGLLEIKEGDYIITDENEEVISIMDESNFKKIFEEI